jgi:hypothetical protein
MDDLQMMRAVLARPELTEEAANRGRRQVQERIDAGGGTARGAGGVRGSRPGRRRAGWTAVTAGLTAAAAVAAVAMGSAGVPPGTARPSHGVGRTAEQSGRDLLLAAAVTAASRPDGVGRFWHVVTYSPGQPPLESWTERNGVMWVWVGIGRQGGVVGLDGSLGVAGQWLTFQQLQQLPADPAALRNWVSRSLRCSRSAATDLASALARLLYDVPAPAEVRTAAFRALAALPGIQDLGRVAGGEKLVIPVEPLPGERVPPHQGGAGDRHIVLVIDLATSLVHSYTDTHGTVTVRTYEWTDRAPAGAPEPGKEHQPPAPPHPACR